MSQIDVMVLSSHLRSSRCNFSTNDAGLIVYPLMPHMRVEHVMELNGMLKSLKNAKSLSILHLVDHLLMLVQHKRAPLIDNLPAYSFHAISIILSQLRAHNRWNKIWFLALLFNFWSTPNFLTLDALSLKNTPQYSRGHGQFGDHLPFAQYHFFHLKLTSSKIDPSLFCSYLSYSFTSILKQECILFLTQYSIKWY